MKKNIISCLVFVFFSLICLFLSCSFCYANWLDNLNKTKLPNGLTIITKEDRSLPVVAVQVWVRVGSVNEDGSNNGVSHFIEHMLFKGTDVRGVGEISKEIGMRGGKINAGTSKDFTYYHIVIPSRHLNIALDILSDAVMNPTFPEEELERERLVILEEIKRHHDNPSAHLWDLLNENLYAAGPYKRGVIGTEEVIRNISRDAFINYYKNFYSLRNMCLVVVGDFKTKKVMRDIKKMFSGKSFSGEEKINIDKIVSEKGQIKKQEIEVKKDVGQTYLNMGFIGPDIKNSDQYAMDLLAYILGRGRSSRLYRLLREEEKLVWDIDASFLTHRGPGPFLISARCEFENVEKARDGILGQITAIKNGALDEKELKTAKMMVESDYLLSNETFEGQSFSLGYYETLYTYEFVQSYIGEISKVTLADIVGVARKYLNLDSYTLVVIRPEK